MLALHQLQIILKWEDGNVCIFSDPKLCKIMSTVSIMHQEVTQTLTMALS